MDPKFIGLGFTADSSLSTFGNLGCLLQGHHAYAYSDSTLWLDHCGSIGFHSAVSKGVKRKRGSIHENMNQEASRSLGHGYSPQSSSSAESKDTNETSCRAYSSAKESKDEPLVDIDLDFSLQLGCVKSICLKKPAATKNTEPKSPLVNVDLELTLSNGPSESNITSVHQGSPVMNVAIEETFGIGGHRLQNDQSEKKGSGFLFKPIPRKIHLSSRSPYLSAYTANAPGSSTTCTSRTQPRNLKLLNDSKFCNFTDCSKRARGSSGLCIAHGGGRRCQRPGCDKGADGKTAFCKAHGGGRRCHLLGCTKSAEGRTDFCIAHGGGRRCHHESCTKAARGKSGLCIRHGGGKRCQNPSCTKSAEGLSGLCISHGGGRRCQYPSCTKGAQGSTVFCKAHGGGKRCTFVRCTKGAEGSTPFCKGHGGGKRCSFRGCSKSVHGGTSFCVAHGGGKRCAIPECTKSARGRTNFCVRHGGGRRCTFEGCGKSAQGSTEFCKGHGGGKRCSWRQPGSHNDNVEDGQCRSLAKAKTRLCSLHGALIQDKRVHGGVTLGPLVQIPDSLEPEKLNREKVGRNETIPAAFKASDMTLGHIPLVGKSSCASPVLEGRVHGGGFLSMVAGGSGLGSG